MAICLPFEILTAIFEQVDDVQDLWRIRNASRAFCAAATPITFRVLFVTSTGGSAQNLGRLIDVPEIAAHVREVAYRDTGVCVLSLPPQLVNKLTSYDLSLCTLVAVTSARTVAIPELASSFSRIHQLPRLESINFMFFPANGQQLDSDSKGRLALQASILGALAKTFSILAPSKLTSLSLHNLRIWDLTSLDSPPFQTVLRTLRRLQLSVIYDSGPDLEITFDRWLHFWGTLCPHRLLATTQHSLTELTLHSDSLVGASFDLSLDGLHFPYLCAISLKKLVFEPSVAVEPFILRHADTLTRLELMACKLPVYTTESFPPSTSPISAYWEDIWDSFTEELTALVILHVDERDGHDFHPSSECRYVLPGPVVSYCEIHAPAHLDESDAAALRRFYMTVAARSEGTPCSLRGGERRLTFH
ncbi:hypothetical protein V8E53_003954 [Lactarius tabidus]